MGHTPYGYRIENGKAVLEDQEIGRLRILFEAYLSGDSLKTASEKAGIKAFHAGVGMMLQTSHYLGDDFYPAIIAPDTFAAVEVERIRRAEKLGRIYEPKVKKEVVYPSAFRLNEGTERFDDPFQKAEYAYSLIEPEVVKDGGM